MSYWYQDQGTQEIIKKKKNIYTEAAYISCMTHPLNLVRKCATDSCPGAVALFRLMRNYTVFSTYPWSKLRDTLKLIKLNVDKSLCECCVGTQKYIFRKCCKSTVMTIDRHQSSAETVWLLNGWEILKLFLLEIWGTLLEPFQLTSFRSQGCLNVCFLNGFFFSIFSRTKEQRS